MPRGTWTKVSENQWRYDTSRGRRGYLDRHPQNPAVWVAWCDVDDGLIYVGSEPTLAVAQRLLAAWVERSGGTPPPP